MPHPCRVLCDRYCVPTAAATIVVVFLADKKIWWEAPIAVRIPTAIVVALALAIRIHSVYETSKNFKRTPGVERVERIVAISLWSLIAVGVTLLLVFFKR